MSRIEHPRLTNVLIDLVCVFGALGASGAFAGREGANLQQILGDYAALCLTFGTCWAIASLRLGAYRVAPSRDLPAALKRMAETWAVTWGVAGLIASSAGFADSLAIWITLLTGFALLTLARMTMSVTPLGRATSRARAVVIGSCASSRALADRAEPSDLEFVGVVPFTGEDPAHVAPLQLLGEVADLPQLLRTNEVEVAVVSPSDQAVTGELHRALRICAEQQLLVHYFPSFLDVDHQRVGVTWSEARPGLAMQSIQHPTFALMLKRMCDITGSLIGLLALLPVFVGCALAVKLTSRGPVFFPQTRVGCGGRKFSCLKFRTMRVGAHAQLELLRAASIQDGPAFKIPQDPRITPVGRLLRKFSLDELPQLVNVLLGDMSIVGPRPPIPTEVDKYAWWQRRRISVKPGLTCVWQVYGRNRVSFKRWVEMDLFYIDNWSLWLDLKLIAHTVRVVLRGTGM